MNVLKKRYYTYIQNTQGPSLIEDTTAQSVVFDDLFGKRLLASFDQSDSSFDGGAILLKGCDQKLGLIDAISACFRDDRQQGKVLRTP